MSYLYFMTNNYYMGEIKKQYVELVITLCSKAISCLKTNCRIILKLSF